MKLEENQLYGTWLYTNANESIVRTIIVDSDRITLVGETLNVQTLKELEGSLDAYLKQYISTMKTVISVMTGNCIIKQKILHHKILLSKLEKLWAILVQSLSMV